LFLRAGVRKLRQTPGMIRVCMAVDEDAHIRKRETQSLDALPNQRRRLLEAAIEQNVSFGRCKQVRRQLVRTDVVKIPRDPEWLNRLIPTPKRLGQLGRSR